MLEEVSNRDFERSPIGKFTFTGSCVLWCASGSLTGWHIWGRPDEDETRTLLRLLEQFTKLDAAFDIVADTRGVEVVNPPALAIFVPWLVRNRLELKRRVRAQANVIHRDAIGFLLVGVLASLGDIQPFRTYNEPVEAFRSFAGDAGEKLCDEVESIVLKVRSLPREIQAVRARLAASVDTRIEDCAKELSTSARSLQRLLQQHGTSFHDEQNNARFALAKTLLGATEDKIASVAHRVGWSERTLTSTFRARTGLTPTDWRKRPPTR